MEPFKRGEQASQARALGVVLSHDGDLENFHGFQVSRRYVQYLEQICDIEGFFWENTRFIGTNIMNLLMKHLGEAMALMDKTWKSMSTEELESIRSGIHDSLYSGFKLDCLKPTLSKAEALLSSDSARQHLDNSKPFTEMKTAKRIKLFDAHYALQFKAFSLLSEIVMKTDHKYESCAFEAGGYKWKLLLYPNGDVERNGEGHISLYLALADEYAKYHGHVNVIVKFFVYDLIRDKCLTIQDGEAKRFDLTTTKHGFPQLMLHSVFKDSRNGYLVDDCCTFGVEVNVIQEPQRRKGEVFYVIKEPQQFDSCRNTLTWKIESFSTLEDKCYHSTTFSAFGAIWILSLHPRGDSAEKGKILSLYLNLVDGRKPYGPRRGVYAELSHWYGVSSIYTRSRDFQSFMLLSDLLDASKGYLANDFWLLKLK